MDLHPQALDESYGENTIPLLTQNSTFDERNDHWRAFDQWLPTLGNFVDEASKHLKKYLKSADSISQGGIYP